MYSNDTLNTRYLQDIVPGAPESEPLQPQRVDTGAEQLMQSAQILERAGTQIGEGFAGASKIVSQQNMINQSASFNKEVNDARTNIMSNPSPVNIEAQQQRIQQAQQMSQTIDMFPQERNQLNHNMQSQVDTFNLAATRLLDQNNKRQQSLAFTTSLQSKLDLIHQSAANGDLKSAQANTDALQNQTDLLVENGILPATMSDRIRGLTSTMVDRGNSLFNNPATTSTDAATNNNFGFSAQQDTGNAQKNTTAFHYNAEINGQNLADATRQVSQLIMPTGLLTDPSVSDADFNHIVQRYRGVAQARGQINTGISYDQLQYELHDLNTKYSLLDPQHQGIRDSLQDSLNQIKNDYFTYYVTQTGQGQKNLQDLNTQISSIQQSGVLSPQDKQNQVNDLQNKFYNSVVAYGRATGIPSQYIKPFPTNDPRVQTLSQAFNAGQDVQPAITALKNSGNLSSFLATSTGTAPQQEAASLVNSMPTNKGALLALQANQNGTDFGKLVDNDGNAYKEKDLLANLYGNSNTAAYLNYIQQLPNSGDRIGAAQKMLLNSMKSCLATNSGNSISDCGKFIGSNVVPSNDSYLKGNLNNVSYNFIPTQLGMNISSGDARAVAIYLSDKVYDDIHTTSNPTNDSGLRANIEANKAINPVKILNGPDGSIIITNPQTGEILNKNNIYLSPSLITTANKYMQQNYTGEVSSKPFTVSDLSNQAGSLLLR